jgi:nucleoside-diphosphate kinase
LTEQTLLIIKPDATARRLVGEILRRVERSGFVIAQIRLVRLTPAEARRFYAVHEGKPFLDGLCAYMASGPIVPVVLKKENAITDLRTLIGATDPAKAVCGTLRYEIGEDTQRNSVHASDSPESAAVEIPFFFGDE